MRRFEIQIISRLRGLPSAAQLRRWLAAAVAMPAEITLRVVNGAEARVLNRDYRDRDYATNVLTFAYGGTPLVADIVLCAPVLAREAREQGKALLAHYAHMCIHGALHASGMDHRKRAQAVAMENREVEILGTLGFDDPYSSRAWPRGSAGSGRKRGACRAPSCTKCQRSSRQSRVLSTT